MPARIAIIGGGAAGMMVAATLAESLAEKLQLADGYSLAEVCDIHIFEKNKELGTKVRISGGGRCNVTTGYYKKQDLQTKYTRGRDFISHAMSQFGPRKMMKRCEDHNVPLHCEDDMRVFPQSNVGKDVVDMFEKVLRDNGVHIHFQEGVQDISLKNNMGHDTSGSHGGYTLITAKQTYEVDFVVITTGGNAYSQTGSTGDGYQLAQSLGHTVTALGPSLNSFLCSEQRVKECSGISFSHATLSTFVENGDTTAGAKVSGPLLLTHFGISGPVTFTYSSQIPYTDITSHQPHKVLCKPFSDRTMERRVNWLNTKAHEEPKKQLTTILSYEFSKRFVEHFLQGYNIDGSQMISNLSREERKHLARLLGDGFPLTLIARRAGDEFVTAGGVNTDEVNTITMESILSPGLYFAGEVLNIDAVTGGFNFQSCRATGHAAGEAIAKLITHSA